MRGAKTAKIEEWGSSYLHDTHVDYPASLLHVRICKYIYVYIYIYIYVCVLFFHLDICLRIFILTHTKCVHDRMSSLFKEMSPDDCHFEPPSGIPGFISDLIS